MWGDHWMFGGFMWIFWGFLFAGLVLLIWWIIRQNQSRDSQGKDDAMDILRKRYAKGEIEKEEFEQKKRDIQSKEF
jgi:putative membrane protein